MNSLPSFITFIGAVISAVGGFLASSSKPKPGRIRIIVVVGLVISAVGAFWSSQQQDSFNLNLQNKSEENARLNQEIARLNQEIVNLISGGDSFCYLLVGDLAPSSNVGRIMVKNPGEYNLYDVHARIVDIEKSDQLLEKSDQLKVKPTLDMLTQADTHISIGNLISSSVLVLHPFTLGNGDTRRFNIFFSARNGFFNQVLRFKKIHGKWVCATKVLREDKVIYEEVDDEFPRTAGGNVEW